MEKNFWRLPMVVYVEVTHPLKLIAFLTAVHAFVEMSAPDMTLWETLKHNEKAYVKISPTAEGLAMMNDDDNNLKELALYYAAMPDAFIVTLNEAALHRALDRHRARHEAKQQGKEVSTGAKSWLGESMGLEVKESALLMVQTLYDEDFKGAMERRSWGNLFILNEWRRRFGAEDPVGFHQRRWQTLLVCPGGGEYVWNEAFQTMESTVYGHPGVPRPSAEQPNPLSDFKAARFGLTFEGDGLRARAEADR
jgi:hypothetical protein